MANNNSRYDVVVVGAGNAAFAAAMAARQEGARVAVLERATKELRGGNTRFTGGIFRTTYNGLDDLVAVIREHDDPSTVEVDPYTRDDFLNDIRRTSGGKADPELSQVLVDRSYETVKWMADLGHAWEFSRDVGSVQVPGSNKQKLAFGGALRAKHEGVGLSETWFRLAEEAGIEILYETEARKILTDESGRVVGVKVRDGNGLRDIHCGALVLASGGFQANPEMRTAYLGPVWGMVKVRGTRFNRGDMHREAMALGAEAYGHWSGCHATPIDAEASDYGEVKLTDRSNRLSYPYSIMVNLDGERFVDEGEDFNLYTYAKFGYEILKQRASVAFQVFDQKTVALLEKRYQTGKPVVADTIPALADAIAERFPNWGFNKEKFIATVEEYNAAVQDGEFDPDVKDGKRTAGLRPEKTNWAVKLDSPPYVAYAVTGGITFTFGGIRVNTNAEVVDVLGRPIPGLYATGEITGGFFYMNYPGGAGLTRGAVFGRIAGGNAAAFARG